TSDGTTDSYAHSSASGWSHGEGHHSATSSGEGQTMLPPEERLFFQEDPELMGLSAHTGSTEGRSLSVGASGMQGSSASHAHSNIQGESESESDSTTRSSADTVGISDTAGWGSGWNEGHGVAQTEGTSEAWT